MGSFRGLVTREGALDSSHALKLALNNYKHCRQFCVGCWHGRGFALTEMDHFGYGTG